MDAGSGSSSEVEECLSRLVSAYYRIVLVVGPSGSGKTALLKQLCEAKRLALVNLGLELSRRLLGLTRRQRRLQAADLVADILDGPSGSALLVDDTEIIFEPSLKLNPLGLLQTVSRRRSLIWSCPGSLDGGQLVYAYPGHPEYYRIPVGEFQVVEL